MKTIFAVALAAVPLASCDSGPVPDAPEPAQASPCLDETGRFGPDLMMRIGGAVARRTGAMPIYEDFNVEGERADGSRRAVLRFRAPELMFAAGVIDLKTCQLGTLQVGTGPHPDDPRSTSEFSYP